jgi:hypothetical protein
MAGTTGQKDVDRNHHLAMVRVAGSNPVFRSKPLGEGHCFNRNLIASLWCPSSPADYLSWRLRLGP